MLEWYLDLGGTEIANHARLAAYLESVGSPLSSVSACGCDTFDAALVGDEPYVSPAVDGAPWYDPDVPESAEFAGLMVLSVEGLDSNPRARTVTAAVTGGAALGPSRVLARTITVTALLLGSSCCGVDYGLNWLGQALEGCTGAGCGGDCMTLFNCCPGAVTTPEAFAARHRRTLRRVALVDGPNVIARRGDGCASGSGCQSSGADLLTVEFVLVAASPWMWTDQVRVLEAPVPTDDGTECIVWCIHQPGAEPPAPPVCLEPGEACPPGSVVAELTDGACDVAWPALEEHRLAPCEKACRFAPCPDEEALCSDPGCRTPTPPVPPLPDTCACTALAVHQEYYSLDLATSPMWFGQAPTITVFAGSRDLRRVTVTFYERTADMVGMTCEEVAEYARCSPHSVYEIAFVPAGGTVTVDGQTGRATVECSGTCESAPDVYGRGGGPLSVQLLTCDRYCVEIAADALVPAAEDATVAISVSGRGY
ncbi:hypothetical protein ACH4RG_22960 [Streptomyces sp. NPDC021019]|uniref:hypothetical protein n=1 Tax=Streptomyces sp. NPDC021019 TaxID=3365108 RepID=UPI00378C947E